jgi:hypothetical protein
MKKWMRAKVFCPTGPGGGVDPTCRRGGGGAKGPSVDFGIDKTEVVLKGGYDLSTDMEENHQRARDTLLKKGATAHDLVRVIGAPNGSVFNINVRSETEILVGYTNKELGIEAIRYVEKGRDGKTVITNHDFRISEDKRGSGVGTQVLAQQVRHSAKMGVSEIKANANRSSLTNGYYTWPRLGYDGDLSGRQIRRLKAAGFEAEKVSDLMKTKEGREWWKNYGDSFDAKFDLSDGSQSRRVLDAYVEQRFGGTKGWGGGTAGAEARRRQGLRQYLGQNGLKVFCPTGPGGGVDPSCRRGGAGAAPKPAGSKVPSRPDDDELEWMEDDIRDLAKGKWIDADEAFNIHEDGELDPYSGEVGTADFVDAKRTMVRSDMIPKMWATQDAVEADRVIGLLRDPSLAKKDDPPKVVRYKNRLYVHDGHHRLAAWQWQQESVEVLLLEGDYSGTSDMSGFFEKAAGSQTKVFCPTGPGGGVDPSCRRGGVGGPLRVQGGEFSSDTFYHGTGSEFAEFSDTKLRTGADAGGGSFYGDGMYLSGEPWKAVGYSYVNGPEKATFLEVQAKIKNPFVVQGTDAWALGDALKREGLDKALESASRSKELTATLKARGHDSVVVIKDDGKSVNELVVFSAKDLKIVKRQKTPDAQAELENKHTVEFTPDDPEKGVRVSQKIHTWLHTKVAGCGAGGGPGKPGFQPGNQCAAGPGGYTAPVMMAGVPNPGSVGSYSGVDTAQWDLSKKPVQHTLKSIAALEKAAFEGDWDTFYKKMTKATKPTKWQKKIQAAQETLLDMKHKGLLHAANTSAQQQVVNPAPSPKPKTPVLKTDVKGDHIYDATSWKKVSGSQGTEKGGVYEAPNGDRFYVKVPDNPERAQNEVLANKLYQLAGARTAPAELVMVGGQLGSATRMLEGHQKVNWDNDLQTELASLNLAQHVWLNNWDAIGAGSENPMANIVMGSLEKGQKKQQFIVDTGGSLDYSGAGGSGKKQFSPDAGQTWDNMQNHAINPSAAKVFKSQDPDAYLQGLAMVAKVDTDYAKALVERYRPNDSEKLIQTLMDRQKSLTKIGQKLAMDQGEYFGVDWVGSAPSKGIPKQGATMPPGATTISGMKQAATKPPAVAAVQAKIKIDPSKFPSKPTFETSNQAHLAMNKGQIDAITKMAAKGEIQDIEINLNAGSFKSPKVATYAKDIIHNVHSQLNPPPPPKPLTGEAKALVDKMHAEVKINKKAPKIGYWQMLKDDMHLTDAYVPEGKFKSDPGYTFWKEASNYAGEKNLIPAIKSYTGNGYHSINDRLREGKATGNAGKLSKGILNAPDLPDGLMLSRKHSLSASDAMKIKPGHVVSDKGILSTSTKPNGAMSGTVLWRMRVHKGTKGLPVDHDSDNGGEMEVLLPPNQRLMVTQVYRRSQMTKEEWNKLDGPSYGIDTLVWAEVLPTVKTQCCPP